MKPNFQVRGSRKSVTSCVCRVPDKYAASPISVPKELQLFTGNPDHHDQWEEGHFPQIPSAEASAEYAATDFRNADVAEGVDRYKSLFCLTLRPRDSVVRAFSNDAREVGGGHATVTDPSFEACEDHFPMYLAQGRCSGRMKKRLAYFSAEQSVVSPSGRIESDFGEQAGMGWRFFVTTELHVSLYRRSRLSLSVVDRPGMVRKAPRTGARGILPLVINRSLRDLKTHPRPKGMRCADKQYLKAGIVALCGGTATQLRTQQADCMRVLGRLRQRSDVPWISSRLLPR